MIKHCSKCKSDKGHTAFNKKASTKDGLRFWCRECEKAIGIAYRKSNKYILNKALSKRSKKKTIDSYCKSCNVYKGKARRGREHTLCKVCLGKQISQVQQQKTMEKDIRAGLPQAKFIHKNGTTIKTYHATCPSCSKDKGFLSKESLKTDCYQCSADKSGVKNRGLIPPNKGIPSTKEVRIKISCAKQGISLDEFDGFITPTSHKLRTTPEMSKLKVECYRRDHYTCQCCLTKGGPLNAHHLNSWKHHLDQRYLLSNLITLCKECHISFHKIYGKGKEANTESQFIEFKERYSGKEQG